jgi:hypothetical protein
MADQTAVFAPAVYVLADGKAGPRPQCFPKSRAYAKDELWTLPDFSLELPPNPGKWVASP